jgi:hypothetical protein
MTGSAVRGRARGLACEAFALCVNDGGRRWRNEPREPSAEIYATIFRDGTRLPQVTSNFV